MTRNIYTSVAVGPAHLSGEGVWNTAKLSHQSLTGSNGVVAEGIAKLLRFPAICSSFRKIAPEPRYAFIGDIETDVLTRLVPSEEGMP